MKRITKILALAVVAVMSISALAVVAEEGKKIWKKDGRPAFSMNEHKKDKEFGKKFQRKDIKTILAEKLEKGEITQEEYDETIAKIESGEFKPEFKAPEFKGPKFNPDEKKGEKKFRGNFGEKPEMTEEQKTEMIEKKKEFLNKMLEEGKITEEEYNKQLENIENGDFHMMGGRHRKGMHMGKGRGMGMHKFRPAEEKAE